MVYNFESHSEELIKIRHHIHSIAEVSGEEEKTAHYIIKTLKSYNPDEVITGIGGNGILARFNGKNEAPSVMLRCELDALPIKEENDLDYISRNKKTGHKCGHDGHMAILCGVAKWLSETDSSRGNVLLLFQPAEETGRGAQKVLDDEKFKAINPDYVFALHNIPGHVKHRIIIKDGPFAAASTGLIVRLKGATAHAAHPEEGKSPALAVAQLIEMFSSLPQFYAPLKKAVKVTVVQAKLGEQAFGTSPGYGEVMATLRTYDNEMIEEIKSRAKKMANRIAKTYDLEFENEWVEPFLVTDNNREATELTRTVASNNDLNIYEKKNPFGWSEDFGHFTRAFKGSMFGLGSGMDQPALHAPDYDFPDEIIESGVKMFAGIIEELGIKKNRT